MFLYLFVMFVEYIIGKILTFIFKVDYMYSYKKLKKDLIEWLVS